MELRILVVDDEAMIRNGIARKIQNIFQDAVIVGKAGDADEALQLIAKYRPQIVITDIRMPEVDGLQFISLAKDIDSSLRFIVISGYQDFEYARSALRLGVKDYLLKPIDNNQFKDILERLRKAVEEDTENETALTVLKESANTSIEFLKNKYFTDLVSSDETQDAQQIIKNLELLDINFSFPYFTAISLIISEMDNGPFTKKDNNQYLEKYAVSNIMQEIFFSLGYTVSFENLKAKNQIVMILNHKEPIDFSKNSRFIRLCHSAVETVNNFLKLSVTIGIGYTHDNILSLSKSYSEAYTAAMQKLVVGDNQVIHISEVSEYNRITFFLSDEEKLLLLNYIKEGNLTKTYETVDKIVQKIKKEKLSFINVKTLYIELLLLLNKITKEFGGSFEKIFSEDLFSENYILRFSTLDSLYLWIKECIEKVCEYINDLRKSSGKEIIEEIIKQIDNYYYMDINLNDLAAKYFINANYLSQLFKNETNINFIDYLTQVRIEKAKSLLLETDLKSYKIAELVGYGNPRYFAEVFTKQIGTTPTKFREQNR